MIDALESLVEKSLLRQEDLSGETRFRMLETIREYAREQLEASGEADLLQRHHAAYYLALAEAADTHLELRPRQQPGGPTSPSRPGKARRAPDWLDRLAAEHDNLRAALTWCAERDPGMGLRLAASLWWFWVARSHVAEGRAWLADLLALPGASDDRAVRATALFAAARLAGQQGDDAAAELLYEEQLAICRGLGDARRVAETLHRLGRLVGRRGDTTAARPMLEESLRVAREMGDSLTVARALDNLGSMAMEQGDAATGRWLLEQALAAYRESGNKPSLAEALHDLERVASEQGDHHTARVLGEEALALVKEGDDWFGLVWVLQGRGDALLRQGDLEAASAFYEQSLATARETGLKSGAAWAHHKLGRLARRQGDAALARARFEEGLALLREAGHKPGIAELLKELADLEHSGA